MSNKIKSQKELIRIIRRAKKGNKKIVFTNGCFDLLHLGHVEYLAKAKAKGDILVVALNRDKSLRRIKGKGRPIIRELARAKIIASPSSVDFVTLFAEPTPLRLIKLLRPDILIKGGDWRREDVVGGGFVTSGSGGGRVEIIPFRRGYSTTSLIRKIKRLP